MQQTRQNVGQSGENVFEQNHGMSTIIPHRRWKWEEEYDSDRPKGATGDKTP